MAPKTDAQKQSQKDYMSHMARVYVTVEPELKDRLKSAADATGLSVNAFIRRAIAEQMERDAPVDLVHAAGGVYCRECEYWTRWERDGQSLHIGRGKRCGVVTAETDFCGHGKLKE